MYKFVLAIKVYSFILTNRIFLQKLWAQLKDVHCAENATEISQGGDAMRVGR